MHDEIFFIEKVSSRLSGQYNKDGEKYVLKV